MTIRGRVQTARDRARPSHLEVEAERAAPGLYVLVTACGRRCRVKAGRPPGLRVTREADEVSCAQCVTASARKQP